MVLFDQSFKLRSEMDKLDLGLFLFDLRSNLEELSSYIPH